MVPRSFLNGKLIGAGVQRAGICTVTELSGFRQGDLKGNTVRFLLPADSHITAGKLQAALLPKAGLLGSWVRSAIVRFPNECPAAL